MTEKRFAADIISFGVDPASGDQTAIAMMSVQKVGWHWVTLPRPSLWERVVAWWRGVELPTEVLTEKYGIVWRRDLIVDCPVVATGVMPLEDAS